MAIDELSGNPWFDVGTNIGSRTVEELLACHQNFQIYRCRDKSKCLVAQQALYTFWRETFPGDLGTQLHREFNPRESMYGERQVAVVDPGRALQHVGHSLAPTSSADVTSFLDAYARTRTHFKGSLQDCVWISSLGLLLPATNTDVDEATIEEDEVLVASWITAGVPISLVALKDIVGRAEFLRGAADLALQRFPMLSSRVNRAVPEKPFVLPGRADLAGEFDRILVRPRRMPAAYARFGLSHANAVLLVGPPGVGKTYAVQEFAKYLNADVYEIRPSKVGSTYIHETSMLISNLFDEAYASSEEGKNVIVFMDEAESYLGTRSRDESGRREEVGELLRRVNQCGQAGIFIIGATNKPELIDSAFLRAGRFESIIQVGQATEADVAEVLLHQLSSYLDEDVDVHALASQLDGKNLADVDFICRVAKRIAAERDALKIGKKDLGNAVTQLSQEIR